LQRWPLAARVRNEEQQPYVADGLDAMYVSLEDRDSLAGLPKRGVPVSISYSTRFLAAAVFAALVGAPTGASAITSHAAPLRPSPSSAVRAPQSIDWPQLGFDAGHSADNPYETTIAPSNVAQLQQAWSFSAGLSSTACSMAHAKGATSAHGASQVLTSGHDESDTRQQKVRDELRAKATIAAARSWPRTVVFTCRYQNAPPGGRVVSSRRDRMTNGSSGRPKARCRRRCDGRTSRSRR